MTDQDGLTSRSFSDSVVQLKTWRISVEGCIRPVPISGFSGMKRLGVFLLLLSPGWDARPSQGYPQDWIRSYPFIHLGGERHCES